MVVPLHLETCLGDSKKHKPVSSHWLLARCHPIVVLKKMSSYWHAIWHTWYIHINDVLHFTYIHLGGCSWCLVQFVCSQFSPENSLTFQASVARASHVPSSCSWCVRSARLRMPGQMMPGMGKSCWATICGCAWKMTSLTIRIFGKTLEAMTILWFGGKKSEMVWHFVRFKI